MTPFRYPKLFVSATSRGLKPLRLVVSERLKSKKYEVVVQEEFVGTYQQIKDMIRDEIAPSDAVVLLVGPAYGFEPTDWPGGLQRCSYTQLEYELAVELKIPVYRYLASEKYPFAPFDPEPAEHQQRQGEYVAHLKAQDHIWYQFDTSEQLLELLERTRFHKLVKPNLPFDSIGTLFKGRDDELVQVRQSLLTRPAHATAVTSKQAIHGLGGVGKTRFAVEYAHRYGTEYSARLYANADTPMALASNMAALVHVLDLPEKDEKEQAKQLEAVERWLRMHAGWLLILDNVDTAEAQSAVNAAFKNLTTGHVLITSRLTDWGTGVNTVELDVLSLPASTEFLLERTKRKTETPTAPARQLTDTDPDEAEKLAEELGRLALALEQAGAYICANRITFAEYRKRLTEIEREILTWFDPEVMRYPKSVAVTWQASVRKLHDEGRNLLNLLCWLAPDPIPVALIRTEPKQPPRFPIEDRERALRDLSAYSLAKWNTTGDAVTVHRLVQDVTRMRLEADHKHDTLVASLALADKFALADANDARTWATVFHPLRPHALALADRAAPFDYPAPASRLMGNVGMFLMGNGEYTLAESLLRTSHRVAVRDDGENSEAEVWQANSLANLLMLTGRFVEAEPLLRRACEVFGRDPSRAAKLASSVSNLAGLLLMTERFEEAESLLHQAVSLHHANLDREPTSAVIALNNLAGILVAKGQLRQAVEIYRASTDLVEKAVGPDHPLVADVLGNLASALQFSDHVADAEKLFLRAIEIDSQHYDDGHPSLLTHRNNLAQLYQATNRLKEAEPVMRQTLAGVIRAYGSHHPRTGVCCGNLGCLLEDLGLPGEAESLLRRALAISEEMSGPDHSATACDLNNLATFLTSRGGYDEAEGLLFRALAISKRCFGPNHPDQAIKLSNLGRLYLNAGRDREAEAVVRRALAIDEAAYGPHHTKVAVRLSLLCQVFEATGRPGEAEEVVARQLVILVLYALRNGQEHPEFRDAVAVYERFLRGRGVGPAGVRRAIEVVIETAGKLGNAD